jgi:Ca2+-binding RTX toxin-like protein
VAVAGAEKVEKGMAEINGTIADDTLYGASADDRIFGLGGHDRLRGRHSRTD